MQSARFTSVATAGAVALLLGGTVVGCGSKTDTSATASSSTTATSAATGTTAKGGANGGKTTTTKTTAKPAGGLCGTWSKNVQGEPKSKADAKISGYFIWQDVGGWHIRVRAPEGKPAAYTGTITGSRDLASAKAVPDGSATVEIKGNQATFTVDATAELKGFDLNAGCETNQLQFVLQAGGFPISPDQIALGTNSKALGSTFTVEKS